eukprot:5430643-Prymnesium_polylepis.1
MRPHGPKPCARARRTPRALSPVDLKAAKPQQAPRADDPPSACAPPLHRANRGPTHPLHERAPAPVHRASRRRHLLAAQRRAPPRGAAAARLRQPVALPCPRRPPRGAAGRQGAAADP